VKRILFLGLTNLLFVFLAWFAMYFPGIDVVVSLVYVGFIWWQGRRWGRELGAGGVALTAALAQLPGFLFQSLAIWYWINQGLLTSNYDFFLQLWHTPFIALLSLIPLGSWHGISLYYWALHLLSPLYVFLMTAAAGLPLSGRLGLLGIGKCRASKSKL
jgi:hypothetical protein